MAGAKKFTPEAWDQVREISDRFKDDLSIVAECLASQDGLERVLVTHVDHAKNSLRKTGFRRVRFFQKTEFEVGVGSALIGVAFSLGDILDVMPYGDWIAESARPGIFTSIALCGSVLLIHGWLRSSQVS